MRPIDPNLSGLHRPSPCQSLSIGLLASGCLLWLAGLATPIPAQAQQQGYETFEPRPLAEVLGTGPATGPSYRLAPTVGTVGYLNEFHMSSEYGDFEAGSDAMLRRLVREMKAIAALEEISTSEAYGEALKQAALGSVRGVRALVTEPVATVKAVPTAVFNIFSRVSEGVKTKVHGDKTGYEDSSMAQALQMSTYKRDYAKQLGVDVYSSNPVLRKQLDSVAWAAAAGGFTVSAASMTTGGAAATALSSARNIDVAQNIVAAEPPAELMIRNRDALKHMGIDEKLAAQFLAQQQFSPRAKTILIAALAAMPATRGKENVLAVALGAPDERTAILYQQIAELLNGYDERVAKITEIRRQNRLVIARDVRGKTVLPAALDYVIWNKQSASAVVELARAMKLAPGGDQCEMWITGTASARFKTESAARGIVVREGVAQQLPLVD
jgi:hypothetical protein